MITPNKVVSLQTSALGKISLILDEGPTPIAASVLWERVHKSFESIDQFILALDVLYILGRIDIDTGRGMVTYAE